MPVGTFLRSGLAVWEQESPHFREGRKSRVGITIITLLNFVVKIFCSALVMGGVSAVGLFGGCGRVGLGAFKDKVGLGAFKDKVGLGAFRHIVIFDFLCLRYVWYYIYKYCGAPTRLSIRGGAKN